MRGPAPHNRERRGQPAQDAVQITTYVSRSDFSAIEAAAAAERLSLSAFVRMCVMRQLRAEAQQR